MVEPLLLIVRLLMEVMCWIMYVSMMQLPTLHQMMLLSLWMYLLQEQQYHTLKPQGLMLVR